MNSAVKVRPVNSLLFLSDLAGGVAPTPVRDATVLSTDSCISFRCYPEQDGPTEVVIGLMKDVDPGARPDHDGVLETPNRSLIVSTVDGETVLQANVPNTHSHVKIWMSHPKWPEKVIIGLE